MTATACRHAVFALALTVWAGCREAESLDPGAGPAGESGGPQLPETLTNSIGTRLILVPAGEFLMGSPAADLATAESGPQHRVTISRPFYLGVYEVTQEEYERIMGERPSHFYAGGLEGEDVAGLDTSRFPVDQVTWGLASEFCRRLSELPDEVANGRTYRLPTEAEWEYACRAGTATRYAFGDTITLDQANVSHCDVDNGGEPLRRTAEVGSYPANAFGLYDMHGNVWEWCADGRRDYTTSPVTDPDGGGALYYALRGGSWDFPAHFCRSDYRQEALAGYVYFGFRIACDIRKRER